MTTHQQGGELIPEWTLGDRLRKARVMTGMTVAEFAERIGVSDRTINNAEGDRRTVRRITLNAWALATGGLGQMADHWRGHADHDPARWWSADYT